MGECRKKPQIRFKIVKWQLGQQLCFFAGVVDACLIPEVPFDVHGSHGLFAYLRSILRAKGHAVVCVAEGAGQVYLFE